MDFEGAKENIQPLATGRNASLLQASLRTDTAEELLAKRRQLEDAIQSYSGDDPLEPWFTYIDWIEQSCPSGGKESGLEEVLAKCLQRFENEDRYYQDRRMIKLYMKFIDSQKDPTECYQQLFNAGIGTMVADFYICWAYYYDLSGNTRKADEIFRRGIQCRAEPLDDLKEAHQHFGFYIGQRLLYQDDETAKEVANRELNERRLALTSLRGFRRKAHVGSIRTGHAVKNVAPGKVQVDVGAVSKSRKNVQVRVLKDENENPNELVPSLEEPESEQAGEEKKSVVRSIIDKKRDLENLIEPGPWNKAYKKNHGKIFPTTSTKSNDLGFNIHEDNSDSSSAGQMQSPITGVNNLEKPFIYPPNFQSKNRPLPAWDTPVTIENEPDANTLPKYRKCWLYPRPNMEFQSEELRAYNFFKSRNIANEFTRKCDVVWSTHDINANIRQYPNFAKHSLPQKLGPLDEFYMPTKKDGMVVPFNQMYDAKKKEEFQIEELLYQRMRRNETVINSTDMEETVCLASDQIHRRKSFFPNRRSMAFKAPEKCMPCVLEAEPHVHKRVDDMELKPSKLAFVDQFMKKETSNAEQGLCEEIQNVTQSSTREQTVNEPSKPSIDADVEESGKLPFSIYQDSTQTITNMLEKVKSNKLMLPSSPEKFEFKTPALPFINKVTPVVKPSLPFEIYEEPKPEDVTAAAAASTFESEETCSTQIFNNFLKLQSMSTPKPQKTVSRQLGVLKDITPTAACAGVEEIEDKENNALAIAKTEQASAETIATTTNLSPVEAKQLSTILETSEHGSTQGTHTTGTSTKSSISSPEFNNDPHGPNPLRIILPYTNLEPLQENSHESSPTEKSLKQNITSTLAERKESHCTVGGNMTAETPSLIRLPATTEMHQSAQEHGGRQRAVFENISRLESKEDSINDLPMPSLRFQDDKTETITKMLLLAPQADIKFPEEKTETISKMLLIRETDRSQNVSTALPVPSFPEMGNDESFEMFCKTPPKMGPCSIKKAVVPPSPHCSASKSISFGQTPIKPFVKRICQQDTPKIMSTSNVKGKMMLPFEDELTSSKAADKILHVDDSFILSIPNRFANNTKATDMPNLQNLSISDSFSFLGPTQKPTPGVIKPQKAMEDTKDKSKLHMSKQDFSFVLGTQVAAAQDDARKSKLCDSLTAEFSFVPETQPDMAVPGAPEVKDNLTDIFIKDFSAIVKPPTASNETSVSNKSLKYLNDFCPRAQATKEITKEAPQPRANVSLKFLSDSLSSISIAKEKEPAKSSSGNAIPPPLPAKPNSQEQVFELNAETEMFAANISSIKNSTWLPNHNPKISKIDAPVENLLKLSQVQPASHLETSNMMNYSTELPAAQKSSTNLTFLAPMPKKSLLPAVPSNPQRCTLNNEEDMQITTRDEDEMSIYFVKTPNTPKICNDRWDDSLNDEDANEHAPFMHQPIDLNATNMIIDNICLDLNVNPFKSDLKTALLDQIEFVSYLQALPTCQLVRRIPCLQPHSHFEVQGTQFEVTKAIGKGAYGAVYVGKNKQTGQKMAFKQERPPNYWELYICLEVQARLHADEMLMSFMHIDFALIGNNASVLVSAFSPYGSLISVCNKYKKHSNKNLEEYVVMLLTCELLEIVDHLHAIEIIHADIKADNFLLMSPLSYPSKGNCLQLIDFGISLDMQRFKKGQQFTYVNEKDDFKCVEMREGRPWTYQLDLYGMAGVIHVLLFGKYMEVEKLSNGNWMHKTHIPRYFNKVLWNTIFQSLLNIRDCDSMPNLQSLRTMLKEELLERERFVVNKVADFNMAMNF